MYGNDNPIKIEQSKKDKMMAEYKAFAKAKKEKLNSKLQPIIEEEVKIQEKQIISTTPI